MPHVVFVAPRFLEATNRYVASFAALDEVTLSVISEDPATSIPEALRARIAAHYRVGSSLDADALTGAARFLARTVGPIDRLSGALEQLQVPMARTRDAVDIEGLRNDVAQAFRDKDRMKAVLRAHDVPVARSALAESPGSRKPGSARGRPTASPRRRTSRRSRGAGSSRPRTGRCRSRSSSRRASTRARRSP